MFIKELQYFSFCYFFDSEWSLIFKKLRAGKTLLRSWNDSPQMLQISILVQSVQLTRRSRSIQTSVSVKTQITPEYAIPSD